MYLENKSEEDYKKQQEAVKRGMLLATKSSSTKILQNAKKELDTESKKETQYYCSVSRMVFNEGIDMYEEGDMTFDEFVEDVSKSLKALSKTYSKK